MYPKASATLLAIFLAFGSANAADQKAPKVQKASLLTGEMPTGEGQYGSFLQYLDRAYSTREQDVYRKGNTEIRKVDGKPVKIVVHSGNRASVYDLVTRSFYTAFPSGAPAGLSMRMNEADRRNAETILAKFNYKGTKAIKPAKAARPPVQVILRGPHVLH